MKLKLVVASLSVLGLITCPMHAAYAKSKHYKKASHQHHMAKKVCPSETCAAPAPCMMSTPFPCENTFYLTAMDAMTQNIGRQVHATPDWFQRVGVVGGINFDGHWGNRSMGYLGENNRLLSLNDAYINVTAMVNDWTKAFASLSFNNATGFNTSTFEVINSRKGGVYSNVYGNNRVDLEQGYITFGNFNCSPFFVQLGKQFQDFGRYQIHPIERTLAQVLSETLATSAKVGFLTPNGFHGSLYSFDDQLIKVGNGRTRPVWGAALGYDMPCEQLGFDLGVGYLSNFTAVNDVAYAITQYELLTPNSTNFGVFNAGRYNNTVGAWNAYGDVNSGPFTIGFRYTTAANKFNPNTLSTQFRNAVANGARPWAADITAGFGFCAGTTQNIYVGYQQSGNAVNLLLPRTRWIVGYGVDVARNARLSAELGHDRDYSSSKGGTGISSNTIGARAAVKFG